jgi:CubicO group peptidase (beta-lactamase class C family)
MRKLTVVLALLASFAWGADAAGPSLAARSPAPAAAASAPDSGAHPLTAEDANAWLDGFMPAALKRGEIAGAAVAIVKDGQVLTERGYGTSDVATGAPVDPRRTLFRPGSISKLFTWTAVMQLVEAGKIDLDADVNQYLDYKIPPRNGAPITMRNLMTHTPGFEEYDKGLIASHSNNLSLGQTMKAWIPTRVFAPGTTPAYSNYGASLAGYIVERVSGEPFNDYIANHIYRPLGMTSSTFAQPLPASLLPNMSKGYRDASKPAEPYEYVSMPPAGSMATTADDMTRFMIAHLQDGRFGETQILRPETAELMHNSKTSLMAPLNGINLGFYDQNINGLHVIAHGGDTQFFHSELELFLEKNVGIFVTVNSAGIRAGSLRGMLVEGFADRYFPAPQNDGRVDAKTAAEHAKMVAGSYISARGSFTNFMALTGLLSQMKVTANPDGTISVAPYLVDPAGVPYHYREISPFVWRQVGGHDRFGAIVKDGKVVRVSSDILSAIMVFDRAPASRNAGWLMPAAGLSVFLLGLTAIGWPVIAWVRGRYGKPFDLKGRRAVAYRSVRAACAVALLAVVGWFMLLQSFQGPGGGDKLATSDGLILLIETVTVIGFVGGLLVSLYNLFSVWTSKTSWFAKLWSIVLALSFACLTWFGLVANLMNFSVNF